MNVSNKKPAPSKMKILQQVKMALNSSEILETIIKVSPNMASEIYGAIYKVKNSGPFSEFS